MGEPYELYGDTIPMVAHFLYYNGTKRYIAPGDVSLFLQLLHNHNLNSHNDHNDHHNDSVYVLTNLHTPSVDHNTTTISGISSGPDGSSGGGSSGSGSSSSTSTSIVRMIPQSFLHAIPTVQWHGTIEHMESITSS